MTDRRAIVGDAVALGLGTGVYALSFGALSVASGLSMWQTQALSLLMFTGASQFALIAVVASGGSAAVAIATSTLIGTRNSFYGFAMAPVLRPRGLTRFVAAQATIDESTGMAARYEEDRASARLAFWSTAAAIYVLWNLGTLIGALGAGLVDDPNAFGLDAAAPAAFLALVWPRLTSWPMRTVAIVSLVAAVALAPFLPAGLPVLLAGAGGIVVGLVLGIRAGEE
ncbi:MAG: AzlC family ABC transporter permease [Candidatus Nanopelagicales bacterium]|jgi:predicted branched-subunit amino acid permease